MEMEHEIKHHWHAGVLFSLKTSSLKLCVEAAAAQGANLQGADLQGADLQGACLKGAYLQGAYLKGAKNISKYHTTPLYILQDQSGKIRAYKLVNKQNEGPYNGGLFYKIGETVSVERADCDEHEQCSFGISLATLDWCMDEWLAGYKILIAEFTAKDIAAIPIGSDGKFRVKKCKIVGEKDLKEIGLVA
jgi:hypothetical protein